MKKLLLIIYVVISVMLLSAALYIYNIGRDYLNVKKSGFLGNTPSNIERLKKTEGGVPFSFAFISDTENSDKSIYLIKTLLESKIDFLVFVGDFVNDSLVSEHKLFQYTISKLGANKPIFIVPSNHDIGLDGRGKRVGTERFTDIYGPSNFSFNYNNCLFIFISNIDQEDKEDIDFLESVLGERNSKIEYTFVFCPTPLRKVINKVFYVPFWISGLDKILDKYKVDYVISGDYHKHLELTDKNGAQYIVSGSGGGHFAEKGPFGRFSNGMKVTVLKDGVIKEIVINSERIIFTDNSIRRYLYSKFMPLVESRFWTVNMVLVFFIINALFSLYCLIKRIEV